MSDELWVIRGRKPVAWTIPFYVKWCGVEAEVFYAVPLLSKQHSAVSELLDTAGRPYNGMWRITRPSLERIGDPVEPGSDPEALVTWERKHVSEEPDNKPELTEDRDDFITELHQMGLGHSREELQYWWNTFCTHMLHWIVNKEKPVDLGFCKLQPSAYRQNWKQVLLTRFPRLGKALTYKSGEALDWAYHNSGLLEEMLCLDLLAMNRKYGYIYRSVEIEHTPVWWQETQKVERTRLAQLGPEGYFEIVMASIRRRLKATKRLYSQFLAGIARPSATDVESGYGGQYRFAPNVPRMEVRGTSIRTFFVPSVVPNKLPRFKSGSLAEELFEKEQPLPEMPAVLPQAQDVRDTGPDLPGPDNQPAGDDGLLVCNPS